MDAVRHGLHLNWKFSSSAWKAANWRNSSTWAAGWVRPVKKRINTHHNNVGVMRLMRFRPICNWQFFPSCLREPDGYPPMGVHSLQAHQFAPSGAKQSHLYGVFARRSDQVGVFFHLLRELIAVERQETVRRYRARGLPKSSRAPGFGYRISIEAF
jgi:hypothetical protein